MSFSTGEFPERFRTAVVTPLHKKPSLPREGHGNYRPVSGLSFISKVIERIVTKQSSMHIVNNGLQNIYQLAYKADHFTETALLKLKNDTQINMAENKATTGVLLDLSAAFEPTHNMVRRTEYSFKMVFILLVWSVTVC